MNMIIIFTTKVWLSRERLQNLYHVTFTRYNTLNCIWVRHIFLNKHLLDFCFVSCWHHCHVSVNFIDNNYYWMYIKWNWWKYIFKVVGFVCFESYFLCPTASVSYYLLTLFDVIHTHTHTQRVCLMQFHILFDKCIGILPDVCWQLLYFWYHKLTR